MASPHPPPSPALVRQARQQLAQGLTRALPALAAQLEAFFYQIADQWRTQTETHDFRAAWERYRERQPAWLQACSDAFRAAQAEVPAALRSSPRPSGALELLSDEAIENRIQASRLALATSELVGSSFEALRLRSQWLQQRELAADDLLRPETICQLLIEQWCACGLPRADLQLLTVPLQSALGELLLAEYAVLHRIYDQQGVPTAQQLAVVRRSPQATLQSEPATGTEHTPGTGRNHPLPHPLQRVRQRTQHVVQQLRKLLGASPAGLPNAPASSALLQALADQARNDTGLDMPPTQAGMFDLEQLARTLRQRFDQWKQQATLPAERAVIEIVALMFQSILAEDRIPPSVRVWFARLQLPVLRVALAEPEFFSDLQHPARQLIDRMGACVMGFDASHVGDNLLEAEIRRLVQLIEQYPETGQRVFQLAHQEFETFLSRYLTQEHAKARIVSLAQQVEQKETLTVQYTIELRRLLQDLPVRAELRDFLFRDWAEVLALSAVRVGPAHAQTQAFKQAASDLVWAGSAKPTREQRSQLIRSLPPLLQCLREGLTLVGMPASAQAPLIKRLTDTLAEAFTAKTAAIAPEDLDAMARRLNHLEDFMAENGALDDAMLSAEHIEMLLGVDIAGLHVLSNTAQPVDPALLEWARTLQPGLWLTLDHNGASVQVQYAWRSQRRQLHLLATLDGQCYLMTLHRLASYLQSGLLVLHDAEGLTLRATRDALAKIEANPERVAP